MNTKQLNFLEESFNTIVSDALDTFKYETRTHCREYLNRQMYYLYGLFEMFTAGLNEEDARLVQHLNSRFLAVDELLRTLLTKCE